MQITICDVGPRDGLQNDPKTLEPPVRVGARQPARRAPGCRASRRSASSTPRACPQMAGAEEVVAAHRARATASSTPVSRSTTAATTGCARRRSTRCTSPSQPARRSTSRTRGRRWRTPCESAERIVARAREDGIRATVTIGTSFGCPFEGAVDAGRVLELAARLAAAGADEIVFADTVGVGVPRQVRELVSGGVELGKPVGVHLHNTRSTGFANAYAGGRVGRLRPGRVGRRHRRLPVRAAGDRQHRDGGPRLPAPRRGDRDRRRPRRADRRRAVARGRARPDARGPGLPRRLVRSGRRLMLTQDGRLQRRLEHRRRVRRRRIGVLTIGLAALAVGLFLGLQGGGQPTAAPAPKDRVGYRAVILHEQPHAASPPHTRLALPRNLALRAP